jgi:hypothetical protein
MITPHLFFGTGGTNDLLEVSPDAYDDDGLPFDILCASVPNAPAGIGGEAIFTAVWLAVQHTMGLTLRFRFFVDEVELDHQDVTLVAQTSPVTEILEFGLSQAILGPTGAEAVRQAPRGTIFVVQVESVDGLWDGTLLIAGRELEVEVVRESRQAQAIA